MIRQHRSFQNYLIPSIGIPINTNGHYYTLLLVNTLDRY